MTISVVAEPYPFKFDRDTTVLIIIDMQRDFLEPGGFGALLGNDVTLLRNVIAPIQRVLTAWRTQNLFVIHTREGHRTDLSDCPPSKLDRGKLAVGIGDAGPLGRVLIRGEWGHDTIDDLQPQPGEPIIDKPGKGSFYATDLHTILTHHGIRSLVVAGVTTEVCVHTTVREANDRGYECLVLADCVGSYFPEFHEASLRMITAQGGIFGWVTPSPRLLEVL